MLKWIVLAVVAAVTACSADWTLYQNDTPDDYTDAEFAADDGADDNVDVDNIDAADVTDADSFDGVEDAAADDEAADEADESEMDVDDGAVDEGEFDTVDVADTIDTIDTVDTAEDIVEDEGVDAADVADDTPAPAYWIDPATGLWWQTSRSEHYTASEARSYCGTVSIGSFTNWRLPTINELRGLIRGCATTATGGACPVTTSCLSETTCYAYPGPCTGCTGGGGSGARGFYQPPELPEEPGSDGRTWSSSASAEWPSRLWGVDFYDAHISAGYTSGQVRCVRN